jgi:hypothetical protein
MSETIALASCYATLVHELTHWTGAKHSLDREFGKRLGAIRPMPPRSSSPRSAPRSCARSFGSRRKRGPTTRSTLRRLTLLKGDQRALFAASAKVYEAAMYLKRCSAEDPSSQVKGRLHPRGLHEHRCPMAQQSCQRRVRGNEDELPDLYADVETSFAKIELLAGPSRRGGFGPAQLEWSTVRRHDRRACSRSYCRPTILIGHASLGWNPRPFNHSTRVANFQSCAAGPQRHQQQATDTNGSLSYRQKGKIALRRSPWTV